MSAGGDPTRPLDAGRLPRVVFVDGDARMGAIAGEALAERARVQCTASPDVALAALDDEPVDLLIADLGPADATGLDLLSAVRERHPETSVVVLTSHASVEGAIRAVQLGASEYLRKPIAREELLFLVDRVLARRRLERENRRLRDALATIDACTPLLESADPGEIHAATLDLLLEATGRRRGFTVFRRASLPGSDGVVFRGFGEGDARALRRLLVEEKRGVALDDVSRVLLYDLPPFDAVLRASGVVTGPALSVPIEGDGAERGVAWLLVDEKPLPPDAHARAELVARYAGLALANAERYASAKERAFLDDVTDVYNARYLLQATENEIQRAARYEKQLAVLFLDLDRFKLVNDRHGHLVGSRVLRRLAEVLKDCVRQVDTLARYGGDEFTILLVDTGLETGIQVAERIRRLVANTLFEGEHGEPIRLTISIGVASFPEHGDQRDVLLDLADKAMYLAKSQGRDCVCSASDLG